MRRLVVLVSVLAMSAVAAADEGMWTFDNVPRDAISKKYGFQLRSDSDENRRICGSLRALSAHIQQNRAA